MNSDFSGSPRDFENTSRYNPKIIEKKMNAQTDWAELTRQQQRYAEQMIQQEKERKAHQRAELNEALSSLVQEKEAKKKMFTTAEKQDDYTHSVIRKQEYDNYLGKVKDDKLENQRTLAGDYSRNMWQKEEEKRKKLAEEKRVEEKMIADALDSLQREKAMKDKMRNDFIQSVDSLMQEKEAQRRREQEKTQQNREEHRRLMDERARNLELQENNYKLYFQRINENQSNRQQVWDQNVGQSARFKDRNIDSFVEKGVEEARRKAELEEAMRQQKKQEQLRNLREGLQTKIQEHEDLKMKEKLSYQQKVEELMRQNHQAQKYQEDMKRERVNHTMDYKTVLESQIRDAEEQKRKFNSDMLDHEKKMHNHFDGLIPGVRSSKFDSQISPHMKSARNLSALNSDLGSPYNGSPYAASPLMNSPYTNRDNKSDAVLSINSIKNSTNSANPFNTNKTDSYNPITNPIPSNIQNPYLAREFQRGGYQAKGVLASTAGRNIIG